MATTSLLSADFTWPTITRDEPLLSSKTLGTHDRSADDLSLLKKDVSSWNSEDEEAFQRLLEKYAKQNGDQASQPQKRSRLSTIPVIGVFFVGLETIVEWLNKIVSFLINDDSGRQILMVGMLLSTGLWPIFVVYGHSRGSEVTHIGRTVMLFLAIGVVALALSTAMIGQSRQLLRAQNAADATLETMRVQDAAVYESLADLWNELKEEERHDSGQATNLMIERRPVALRSAIEARTVQVFVDAKDTQARSLWMRVLICVGLVFVGLENIVCGAILSKVWFSEVRESV